MSQSNLNGTVYLEAGCRFVPVRRIRKLVIDSIGTAGDDVDEVEQRAFEFGFRSTRFDAVAEAVRAWREAGKVTVYEESGFGVIRDDDVQRGALSREDFARLIAAEWQVAVVERSSAKPGAMAPHVDVPPEWQVAAVERPSSAPGPMAPHVDLPQLELVPIAEPQPSRLVADDPVVSVAEPCGATGLGPAVANELAPPTHPPAVHVQRRRADALGAVIALAKERAVDSADWQSVWAALVALAQPATRPAPLLGYVEGEGVQYQTDDAVQPAGYLNRNAFRKRFKRKG